MSNTYHRKGYYKENGTYVHPTTVHLSHPIRGRLTSVPKIKVNKEKLTKLHYSTHKKQVERRKNLDKSVKEMGYSEVIKELNVLAVYNKNLHPATSKKIKKDMKYLGDKYRPGKNKIHV